MRTIIHIRCHTGLSIAVQVEHMIEWIDDAILNRIQHRRFANAAVQSVTQIAAGPGPE